ncbi:TPA: hypothetical protein ACIAIE_004233 [Serratia fonticola]|uniref:hypothetical protein n=1 Tax=Serratia fonticola TaxID=47917 RepID=UPI001377D8D9|nr:hypothetical protein [Serratia fonticola]MBC3216676.1 hypothetical protein [Serratia fonticola]NBJ33112.1 hypothetical protein [Serratia fonticola]
MMIKLDLTSKFNVVVDYTGVSDLHTYVDAGLTDNLSGFFELSLINFVLNLDSEFISILKDKGFSHNHDLVEDGFLIIKKAKIKFLNIKGGDAEFSDSKGREDRASVYKTWPCKLSDGDRVYQVGGGFKLLPEINVFMYLLSNASVMMDFYLDDAIYLDSYSKFVHKVKELNAETKNLVQKNKPGLFFESAFREQYIINNIDSDELIIKAPRE